MALQASSQNTYLAVGQREDLTDIVALIDPQDTPFMSTIGTDRPSTGVKHEWQVQPLTAPSKTNFQLEGDDSPANLTATPRERLYNYNAISRKVGAVTGTMRAVQVAGISDEYDNQVMLRGIELRRDMEVILLDNNAQQAGGTLTARECAGLGAYITNVDMTGSDLYSAATGDGTDAWNLAATTSRAMTLTLLNAVDLAVHTDGGKPDTLILPARLKQLFSGSLIQSAGGAATRFTVNEPVNFPLLTSVEIWMSDFGNKAVLSDVQMSTDSATTNGLDNTAYFVDTAQVGVSYLRRMFTEALAKTGDNDKFECICEYTLQVDAPKAHGALFALS